MSKQNSTDITLKYNDRETLEFLLQTAAHFGDKYSPVDFHENGITVRGARICITKYEGVGNAWRVEITMPDGTTKHECVHQP